MDRGDVDSQLCPCKTERIEANDASSASGTPTVSVVMPARGRPAYVKRAINSVLEQSFPDFELLILDNSPQLEKDEILEMSKCDSRIGFVHRGNIGVTEARKLGATLSRGRLFALLDSDDYWHRDRLKKHVEVWSHNRIGLSWDRWAEVRENWSSAFPQTFSEGLISPPKVAARLYHGNFIHASSGIVSAEFARTLGFPLLDIMSSDWTLFMRAAEYYPAYFIGETLSFKEMASPDRVSAMETEDFFRKERFAVMRWALVRPEIYGSEFLKIGLSQLRRIRPKLMTPHEPSVMRALSRIHGRVFLDVGANRGQFSTPLSKNFEQVIAVEPNPSLVIKGRNIRILRCALSDNCGEANLYIDQHPVNRKWTLDTIMDSFNYRPGYDPRISKEIRGKKSIRVATRTLDSIVSDLEQVDLVKIDVEGAEFLTLQGARESLSSRKILNLVVEVHDRERKMEMETLLGQYGYEARWLDRDHIFASAKLHT